MAEAAYATGPVLLSSIFFLNFLFSVSARGPNSAPERGPKESKPPRKLEAPKNRPQSFLFVPCFSVSARGPKERKVPRKRGALNSLRLPKAKPQTKKTARPKV